MDKELMIKMGWSQDLIESALELKKKLDESMGCSPDAVVAVQNRMTLMASSIDTRHLVPIAENKIRV